MSFSEQQCKWYVRGSAVPATVHKITGGGSSTGAGVAQPGNQRAGVKYKVYYVFLSNVGVYSINETKSSDSESVI